jgi:uncharacterized protein (DUF2141 family)
MTLSLIILVQVRGFSQGALKITINKVRNNKGVLVVTLFKHANSYMKDFSVSKTIPAASQVVLTFDNLQEGEYAITVMHDENNNNKFDSNFIGIPKEGTGFSNNASATFGPPSWEKAKFKCCDDSKPQIISLKYW